jgi:hypothetical protein
MAEANKLIVASCSSDMKLKEVMEGVLLRGGVLVPYV